MHAISVRLSCENMVTSLSHVFLCFPGSITDLFFNDKHCIMSVTPVFVIFFYTILAFLSVPLIILTRFYVVSVLRHSVFCHSFCGLALLELCQLFLTPKCQSC